MEPRNPTESLSRWLASTASRIRSEAGRETKITVQLITLTQGGQPQYVNEFPETTDSLQANELAQEILETADQDAFGTHQATYYAIIVGVNARFPIHIDPSVIAGSRPGAMVIRGESSGYGGGPQYPMYGGGGQRPGPPEMGNPMTAVFHSFVERERIQAEREERLLDHVLSQSTLANKALAEAHETMRSYEKSRTDSLATLEELSTKKHERELELQREHKKDERIDKAFQFFEPIAYGAMAKLGGAQAIPAQFAPIVQLIASNFGGGKFDGAKLAALVTSGILSTDQAQTMLELFKVVQQVAPPAADAAAQAPSAPVSQAAEAKPAA